MECMKRKDKTIETCELIYEAEHRELGDGLGVVLIEKFRDKSTGLLHHPLAPAYVVRDFSTLEAIEERNFIHGKEVENIRVLTGMKLPISRNPS